MLAVGLSALLLFWGVFAAAAPAHGAEADPDPSAEAPAAAEPASAASSEAPGVAEGGGFDPVFDEDPDEASDLASDEIDPLFDDSFDEDLEAAHESYPDPLESTNRGVLAFNRQVDRWILDPVTEAYQWAVPKPARNAVSRFFLNLGSTKTLVNDCLQLEWQDAGVTTARLLMNTTVGVLGLFDVAESVGLPGHESDFGQTLALAGTPSGPYLLLPVLGPSTLRDGFGVMVDGFFQPTYYILGPMNVTLGPVIMQSPGAILIYGGSSGLTLRDRNYAKLKDLESSSVDYYAAMRSGFYQDRVGQIWGRRTDHRTTHEPGEDDDEP
ncbi:MAG: VacJ family lipoprotein [Deltaproteobacteria bacterium]|nr:VacJ family lipoprotein [Deltaproteobacteria bacterium]